MFCISDDVKIIITNSNSFFANASSYHFKMERVEKLGKTMSLFQTPMSMGTLPDKSFYTRVVRIYSFNLKFLWVKSFLLKISNKKSCCNLSNVFETAIHIDFHFTTAFGRSRNPHLSFSSLLKSLFILLSKIFRRIFSILPRRLYF